MPVESFVTQQHKRFCAIAVITVEIGDDDVFKTVSKWA